MSVRNQLDQGSLVSGFKRVHAARGVGLSVAALMLAGTALAPANAQVADLGGLTVSRNDFSSFASPGIGLTPTEITNGSFRLNALVDLTYSGDFNDSLGMFSFTKRGTATVTLAGNNTHFGLTAVTNGRIIAGSTTALSANSQLSVSGTATTLSTVDLNGFSNTVRNLTGGPTGVVTSTTGPATLTVNSTINTQFQGALQGNLALVKIGAGRLDLVNADTAQAPSNFTGGVTLAAGTLRVGSDLALGTGTLTVTGAARFGTTSVAPRVLANNIVLQDRLTIETPGGTDLTLDGVISGNGGITKLGVGQGLRLTAANSYSGGTTLSGGTIFVGDNSSLGTGDVNQTQTSFIGQNVPGASITLANNFILPVSSLQIFLPDAGGVFTFSGNISGTADINLITPTAPQFGAGGGTVALSGNNSLTGLLRLRGAGTLEIASGNAVNTVRAIRVETPGTTVRVTADNQTISTRLISLAGGGAQTTTLDIGSNNLNFAGSLRDGNTPGGDTLAITKIGSGILTVSNADTNPFNNNILSGGLFITEGTLNLTGGMTNAIAVSSGARLTGTGFQDLGTVTIADGATLSPGDALAGPNAIGTLSFANLTLGGGATTIFDLGIPSINTASPVNDLVVVSGNLDLGGIFNFNILPGFTAGTYRLMTYGGALSGGVTLGVLPAGFNYALNIGGGFVDLEVQLADFYWDGSGPADNGGVDGGTGTWNAGNSNWTNVGGTTNIAWQDNANAYFTAAPGQVTVDGNFTYSSIAFTVGGYVLNPAEGGTLNADAGSIDVAAGATATVNVNLIGTNGLAKQGDGILVLGGTNSFTGGLSIDGGTLAVTQAAALGADAVTINGTAQTLRFDAGMTVSNNINGVGVGYNVDTGANTVILNGSLSGGGADKVGSGTLVLNNAVNDQSGGFDLQAGSLIVNGGLQGNVLVQSGTVLGGTGTITNAISQGTISSGTAAGLAGTLTFADLELLSGNTALFDLGMVGVVGGTNDLVVVNNGLTLDGTLNVNPLAGWNIGTGSYRLINYGGALTDNGLALGGILLTPPADVTYAVDTSAAGQVNLVVSYAEGAAYNWDGNGVPADGIITGGAGTWNGAGTNWTNSDGLFNLAYVDGTGTIANFGGVAGGGAVDVVGTRTFGTLNFTADGYVLGGAGSLAMDAGIINVTTGTATINVALGGTGGLTKNGAGELSLGAANGYTGGTNLTAGTIRVGNNAALGTDALTMAGGTTLVAGAADLNVGNAIVLGGAATIDTGAFLFATPGVISGAGSLTKIGSGVLFLDQINTYAGGTNVNGGTLVVYNPASAGTGTIALADGTQLANAPGAFATPNAITITGTASLLTQGAADLWTLSGVIANGGGAGTLAKNGAGTLILTNANTYTGGTNLNGGTIRVGNNNALGTGTLAMAGGTTLQAGAPALTVGNAIALLESATVDVAGEVLTLGGVVSGTGPLLVIDSAAVPAAALVLTGVNTYTGGTVVTGTTVQVSQDANLGNAAGGITLVGGTLRTTASFATARSVALGAGGGTVNVASDTTLTTTGVFSGTSLTKTGTGTLALNAANTYAGGTALNAGTISVGNNAALGAGALTMADGTTLAAGVTGLTTANNITVLGAATINSGATPSVYTLSGVISGAGSVVKQGTGTLNLTGASTYAGATTVAAGTLGVAGSLVSAVTVNSGATLAGTGTVGALNVLTGGSVAPGAAGTTNIGTLAVTGAATLAGTYTVNIAGLTNDRITAGGALTLGGALVVAPATPFGVAMFNQTYTIASGSSRTGTFASTTGLGGFGLAFAPVVEYTATQANIRLAPNSLVAIGNLFGGLNGNPLEVALAFDRAVAGGYNPQAFFAVYANAGSNLSRTLREMSGEQRATERRVVLDSNRVVRETALDRLNLGLASMAGQQVKADSGDSALTFWLRGAGSWGKAQTSGAATAFKTEQLGLLTGIDWARDSLTVGGMFHYTTTDVTFSTLGGSSRVETVGGTVYAGWRQQDAGFVVNGGVSLSSARTNGNRAITLTGFTQSLAGRTTGTTYQVFGELAYDLAKGADTSVEPFVRNSYIGADINALNETGGVAALSAPKQSYNINVLNAGMRIATTLQGGKFNLNGSASFQRTSGAREAATFIGIPAVGQNGNIRAVSIDPNALLLQAGVGAKLSEKIRFSLDYSGQYGKNNDDHGARATLNFAF